MRFIALLISLVLVFTVGHLSGRWWPGGPAVAAEPDSDQPSVMTLAQVGPATGGGQHSPRAASNEPAPVSHLGADEQRTISIFRSASPAVANISSRSLQRDFYSLNVYEIPAGTGSGIVWDRLGHIVTNYHVITQGQRYTVTLGDQDFDASLVGVAPHKDLAVLRIEAPAEQLLPLALGDSANLMVGQRVLAIGNPFGLDQTLTVGVVSALGRELNSPAGRPIRDVVQIDAAINPGNSGGPLLDSGGRLIGINTAIYSPTGASAGIGFAVPVDTVRRLVPQLIEHGKPVQPGIGIELLPDHYSSRLGIQGVIVHMVDSQGPAGRAGIRGVTQDRRGRPLLGDVIIAIDDQAVGSLDDLVLAFEDIGVGNSARLRLSYAGDEREIEIELVPIG